MWKVLNPLEDQEKLKSIEGMFPKQLEIMKLGMN